MNIMEGYPETRYQVFTAAGMQTYYESQIDIQESDEEMEKVDAERFNAGLTASYYGLIFRATQSVELFCTYLF